MVRRRKQLERAAGDPRRQMALVFRRYLFFGAQWARDGESSRTRDFQIWCGPSMGAFNEWVAGSPLEALETRTVKQMAWNLLDGAAHITRMQALRASGHEVRPSAFEYPPGLFE